MNSFSLVRFLLQSLLLLGVHLLVAEGIDAADPNIPLLNQPFTAFDTLDITEDAHPDANDCLRGFHWAPEPFAVAIDEFPANDSPGFAAAPYIELSFPSPRGCGIESIDRVVCEWYPARDKLTGELLVRPAILVVHESGSAMRVGRLVAVELGRRGVHAFLIQLPGYGQRQSADFQPDDLVSVLMQGISDVRRARDAIAALPVIDDQHIGIQGTSLGGFVATLAASLDSRFDSVFLLLCGGDLHGVLGSGAKDAQKLLNRLRASGTPDSKIESALRRIEPLRVAHRLQPERTWLYSASFDTVVLPKFSRKLAEAARLPPDHHYQMLANHYSGVIYLPGVLEKMRQTAVRLP